MAFAHKYFQQGLFNNHLVYTNLSIQVVFIVSSRSYNISVACANCFLVKENAISSLYPKNLSTLKVMVFTRLSHVWPDNLSQFNTCFIFYPPAELLSNQEYDTVTKQWINNAKSTNNRDNK